ncbi:MAG: DPP IV N-terminal domain-containing protein, partial [Acidobacteriota bacterium]|nr:DPP IV N-terminal domain-containing protein [Acidobacteriota bacterium]
MNRIRKSSVVLFALLVAIPLFAQQPARQPESQLLSLDTVLTFRPQSLGQVQWLADGSGYLTVEPTAKGGASIMRSDAATGAKSVLVPAEKLVPAGASSPLAVEEFTLSADEQRMLIFTKTERVWRSNTRGDYWVFDLKSAKLQKLGGDAKPSTLMFAKFSPDGMRVGYVRENNIYVESLDANAGSRITQLTTDGAQYTVNG